jgi:hypothetical protein
MGCTATKDLDATERRENGAIEKAQREAEARMASTIQLLILGTFLEPLAHTDDACIKLTIVKQGTGDSGKTSEFCRKCLVSV